MVTRSLLAACALIAALPVLPNVGGSLLTFSPLGTRLTAQEGMVRPDHISALRARSIGPASMSGRIVDLAVVEMDPKVFYVASATGGLWKTTNNAVTFTPLFQDEAVHSIGDVAVHQIDTSLVWVGSGERANRQSTSWGDGVYRSRDGGESWENVGLRDSRHIGRIALHPTDPDVVYVAAMGHLWGPNAERGLYKSTDGGDSWERVLFVDEDTGVVDVAIDPLNPNTLYAASYQRRRRPYGFHGGGPGSALWTSVDGGSNWTKLTNAGQENGLPTGDIGRIGISIFRSDPNIVYVSVEQGLRYNASTAYEERLAGVYRSENWGSTWEFMSDWNPRPMYASQILVDPSDDQRIYMQNSFSWSDDGGKTFTSARQTLHGDDRFLWVDPNDSRHVMKADDGGLGISYDRARTWLYITHLPISQFYHVSFDYQKPYWVYGGLQDNGSWAGPSATYRSEGILNHDWVKWGGGDGFLNLVDTTENRALYVESQYLGLDRVDLETGQRQRIRPGDPTGAIGGRKNWTTWQDLSAPEQRLGNAMAPANWDGPFLISPHDPHTIFAGTNILWKSNDEGRSWENVGDLTTGVDRRTLRIMGELPTPETLSLDDGIPYYPSLTAVAESPVEEGVLYVGTDDGNVQVSRDGGATWEEISESMPELPTDTWINGIEASRFEGGRVYVAVNNYRNDDYSNYLYASDDYGATWTDIACGLPDFQVTRTVREDPRNQDVLYLGTEFGLFFSPDRGLSWIPLDLGLPTTAVNDLVIHPRDNDLIIGTHGQGIWILDDLSPLQELTPQVLSSSQGYLFQVEPAEQIRYRSEKGHNGDMIFRGENPDPGARIFYWLPEGEEDVSLNVISAGERIATLRAGQEAGVNRTTWNLRYADPDQGENEIPRGPLVTPGTYVIQLSVGGSVADRTLEVREDPRIQVEPEVRQRWTDDLLELGALSRDAAAGAADMREMARAIESSSTASEPMKEEAQDLLRQWSELQSRARRLLGEVQGWVGPVTQQQATQWQFYLEMVGTLGGETEGLAQRFGGGVAGESTK